MSTTTTKRPRRASGHDDNEPRDRRAARLAAGARLEAARRDALRRVWRDACLEARGEPGDEEGADRLARDLAELAMSDADFEQWVEIARERLELERLAAELPARAAAKDEACRLSSLEHERLDAIRKELPKIIARNRTAKMGPIARWGEAVQAESKLLSLFPGALVRTHQEAKVKLQAADQAVAVLRRRVADATEQIERGQAQLTEGRINEDTARHVQAQVEDGKRLLKSASQELESACAVQATRQAEVDAAVRELGELRTDSVACLTTLGALGA